MSEININSNNHSDIEISENNFIDVELDNGDIENIETEISEPDCIEIEINGLMSSNSFIGLEDTPMYYIDGKFFKVEGNKLVYTDIDWADITGDIKGNPGLEDQIKEIASQYSKEFIIESVDTAVQKHNLDEKSHPFLIDMILNNYASINKKVDEGLGLVNTRVDNLELATSQNTDNINVLLDEQADINQALNNIEYDVVKNASDIANLTPRVTNNENKIVELNEKIKDIAGADLTELNNKVNKNSGDITNLTQKVDNNYHELSLNTQNNFDILNNKIADNSIKINTNTQDIVDIKLKATTDYTELKNKINSNSTKIDTNTKDIYQNTLTINENTLAIADNSKLINSTIENLKSYSKTSAFASVAFSGEYTDLLNTPDIPSIDGLASTNYVNEYVNNAISGVVGLKFIVVDRLPEVGKNGYIYLVPDSKSTQDVYTEYIWLEDQQRFEQFGLSEVNLENYYTKDIVDAFLDTKVDKVAGKSLVSDTEINRLKNVKNYDDTEIKNSLDSKQDILIAGKNIDITQNVISSVDTKYTAGEGIAISPDNIISNTQTSAEWGKISGDINTQVDLVNELDSKQDVLTEANAGNGISIENGIITNTKTETSWGEIKGDINSQLDLKKELDNKQDINSLSINGVILNNNKTLNELGIQPQGDYVTHSELPKDITTQGNTFNGSNQLVQLLNDGTLPKLDASNLYNVKGRKGDKGDKGDTSTIEVGSVVKGDIASVKNVGTNTDAIFDFVLPKGDTGRTATVKVGKVNKGDVASVKNVGTSNDAIFDFVLPKGDTGRTATVKVGKVEKGDTAKVTNVGTSNDAIFDFVLPKGDQGIQGIQGPQGKGANNGTQLTNQNLDTYKTEPLCGYYYAGGGNTVKPKPSGVDAFGLWVLRTAVGYYQQELHTANTNTNKVYIRTWNSSAWTPWVEKGVKGDTGARGPQGEQGPRGEKGETGDGYSDAYHMYMTGNITNDERGYKQLVDMKHSTFDKSKFQVVGSPSITDDGVVSGFSGTNYIKTPIEAGILKGKSWKISFNAKILQNERYSPLLNIGEDFREFGSVNFFGEGTSRIRFSARTGTASDKNNEGVKIEILVKLNTILDIEISFDIDTSIYTLKIINEDGTINSKTWKADAGRSSELYPINENAGVITLCHSKDAFHDAKQIIDLKAFSISVDGKEVFSGNKTGIDIIKPDNFEVVGNPVISDDGIASGFDTNNAIFSNKTFNFSDKNDLDIYSGKIYVKDNFDQVSQFFNFGTLRAECRPDRGSAIMFYPGGSAITLQFDTPVKKGDIIQAQIHKRGTKVSFIVYVNDKKYEYTADRPNEFNELNKTMSICSGKSIYFFEYGEVDLNTVKFYIDGNLVYQPCLKIPYTESKTGSKIVDSIYRDRVTDVFEQTGKALYYTLDEANKNITLPAGEIYGMLGEGGVGNPDNVTIKVNEDKQLQAIGTLERNKQLAKYDWVGTLAEYEAQDIVNKHPDWICFITDDCGEYDADKVYQIGCVVPFLVSKNYIPAGFVRTDGTEFTKGLFPDLWTDFLQPITIGTKQVVALDTCTYDEYSQDISRTGACVRWAVDTVKETFKVPFIPDGYYFKAGQGVANKAGLPNVTGNFDPAIIAGHAEYTSGAFRGTNNRPTVNHGIANIQEPGPWGFDFDASRSNPIYGKSDTVETNAVGLRWFVRIANSKLGKSLADWSAVMDGLNGKVNKSGDTMTGDLVIEKDIPIIKSKSSTLGKQDAVTEGIKFFGVRQFIDKNNNEAGYLNCHKDQWGATCIEYGCLSPNNQIRNELLLYAKDNGETGVFVQGKVLRSFIYETYINGTSGYNLYSNGYCEQWGIAGETLGNGYHIITVILLKPYRDTLYNVVTAGRYRDNIDYGTYMVYDNTTTQFTMRSSGRGAYWRACGYCW